MTRVLGPTVSSLLYLLAGCTCATSHLAPDASGSSDAEPTLDAGAVTPDAWTDPSVDAGPPAPAWRWSNPQPVGNALNGVWGAAADDVWAVGAQGTILHFDGVTWSSVPSGTTSHLHAVWGSGPDDVWAVGGETFWTFEDEGTGVILHWDGRVWTSTMPGTRGLRAVWGTAANDVWAVGYGTILHFDGVAWTSSWSGHDYHLLGVFPGARDDVWAVGDYPPILHFDGVTWTPVEDITPGIGESGAVWGTAPDDVWTVSRVRGRAHWDGSAWTITGSYGFRSLSGTAPDDLWAVGPFSLDHWDGDEWSSTPAPYDSDLRGVFSSAPDDVWAVGAGGTILHFDGATWTPWSSVVVSTRLEGIFAISPTDVWAVGWRLEQGTGGSLRDYGVIVHGDGETWSPSPSGTIGGSSELHYQDVWGSGPDDVWAVGWGATMRHWDGTAWSDVPHASTNRLESVWGTGAGDVWVAGYEGTQHWDGTAWTMSDATWALAGVGGSGPNDVWTVGDYGMIRHFDGSTWSTSSIEEITGDERYYLRAVWSSTPDDVWVVGGHVGATTAHVDGGVILHWDGRAWSSEDTRPLESVWGAAADDVWAVGERVLHWDGRAWTEAPDLLFDITRLADVSGLASDAVWAVGAGGVVLERSR